MKESFGVVYESDNTISVSKWKSPSILLIKTQYHVEGELDKSFSVFHESHDTTSIIN